MGYPQSSRSLAGEKESVVAPDEYEDTWLMRIKYKSHCGSGLSSSCRIFVRVNFGGLERQRSNDINCLDMSVSQIHMQVVKPEQ